MEGVDKELHGKYAHIANMLLKQLKTKEITLKEFLTQCAYWGVKTLDDIYFKSLPSKPREVVEYEQLPWAERKRLTWEYYSDHPEVMGYYDEEERVMRMNKTNLMRMKEYKEHIPESDVKAHEKLDKRILNFKMKTEDY